MAPSETPAQRFVEQLEQLLEQAREAAAATLLQQTGARPAPTPDPNQASLGSGTDGDGGAAGGTAPGAAARHLRLHRCAGEWRAGRRRALVQYAATEALYEGEATARDVAEGPLLLGARAAVAALGEWAAHAVSRPGSADRSGAPLFGLGTAMQIATAQGNAVVVTLGVNGARSPGVQWLLGSAWLADDPVEAAARAVLAAVQAGEAVGGGQGGADAPPKPL